MRYGLLLFAVLIVGLLYLITVFFPAYQAQQQNCNEYAAQANAGNHAALSSWISQNCECYGGNYPRNGGNTTINYDSCQ